MPSMGDVGDLALNLQFEATIGPKGRIEEVDDLTSDVPYADRDINVDLTEELVGVKLIEGVGKRFEARVYVRLDRYSPPQVWLRGRCDKSECSG